MPPLDLAEIEQAAELTTLSTPEQRRTLYRMGRSRYWVRRFARTRIEAAGAIRIALEERAAIEAKRPSGFLNNEANQ